MKKLVSEYSSDLAIHLVQEYEGYRSKAYICPAGIWTIGFGHTGGVKEGQTITEEEAINLLKQDLAKTQNELSNTVQVPVSKNQFIALMSFTFNIGITKVRTSTLMKYLNQGEYALAGKQLLRWVYANGVKLPGLEKRREAEYKIWNQKE